MSQELCRIGQTNVVVALLVVLFAISSWVDINGLWVELPILVQRLPEGWNLPSYMTVIIQVANIAPLVYTVTRAVRPQLNIELAVIYIIITTGAVSCLLLAFLWDHVAMVGEELHSVGLLSLQFFLALVDCTSSVAYLPFMGGFQPGYLNAFFVGEGFSGLLPSLVSLAQGAGNMRCVNYTSMENITVDGVTTAVPKFSVFPVYETPRFSIEVFFFFLFGMLVVSFLAFTLLNFWSYAKKEKVDLDLDQHSCVPTELSFQSASTLSQYELGRPANRATYPMSSASTDQDISSRSRLLLTTVIDGNTVDDDQSSCTPNQVTVTVDEKRLSRWEYVALLVLTAWVNALGNGVLPSIQSFSCLPYGIEAYHFAVTLASIANPVACFVTFFVQVKLLRTVGLLTLLGSGLAGYVIFTAAASPSPPLVQHSLGPFSVITAWVLVVFLLTYSKVSIATMFREEGRRALLWCGALTQVGSLVGAVVTFFLVNFYKLFQQANMCG
ncbi:hypothetical protein BaRGS_00003536 [Batillaria attramentaria]|uniref:Riboflavin transporter n=1 Tax=Batillaria attramentaria TaxID=370345 RepID=A0ABD0M226_9CAEN